MKSNPLLLVLMALFVSLALTSCGSDVPIVKPIIDVNPLAKSIEFLSKCAVLITLLVGGFKMMGRKT